MIAGNVIDENTTQTWGRVGLPEWNATTPFTSGQSLNLSFSGSPGSGQWLNTSDNAGMEIAGVNNWTMEFWTLTNQRYAGLNYDLASHCSVPAPGAGFYMYFVQSIGTYYFRSAPTTTNLHLPNYTSLGVWNHWEINKAGSWYYLYLNGTLRDTHVSSTAISDSAAAWRVGYNPDIANGYFPGKVDNFQLLKHKTKHFGEPFVPSLSESDYLIGPSAPFANQTLLTDLPAEPARFWFMEWMKENYWYAILLLVGLLIIRGKK